MHKLFIGAAAALACHFAAAAPQDAAAGARMWSKCSACHSATPGVQGMLGPNLANVLGRKAGSLDGYAYSPAMKNAGLTWNAATLDAFIKAPMEKVPGTRMAFAGVKDDQDRAALVRYLAAADKDKR